jgi:DNA-binding IclR family transcriptional regulator
MILNMRTLRNFKPNRCYHLISRIAFDLLKLLVDGPKRPAELRSALGISSVNFFTSRYLKPLARAGYISVDGGEKNRFSPGKRYRLLCRGKAVTHV